MKKALGGLILLFALALATGAASAQTYTVNLTWTNTDTSTPVCSSTVTKACIKSRTMTDVTVSTAPVVLSSAIVPTLTAFTTPSLNYTAPITRMYTLVTSYLDGSGAAQVTTPANCGTSGSVAPCQVPVFIVLPPSNLQATPVQTSALIPEAAPAGMM